MIADPVALEQRRVRARLRQRRYRRSKRAAGLCWWCSRPATVGNFCAPCHARLTARYRASRAVAS